MNSQQRWIVVGTLVGLATFSSVMAFKVPFLEFKPVSGPNFFTAENGPDFLFFRARHRTAKYDREYLQTVAARSIKRRDENERKAEEMGLTYEDFVGKNPIGVQSQWEWYIRLTLMVGDGPTVPSNLTLSVLAGIGLPIVFLAAALFVFAGGRGKPIAVARQ